MGPPSNARAERDFRIDLGRARSIAQLLGSTVALYRRYPWLFFVLAALVIVPWNLLELAVTGHGPLGRNRHETFLERQTIEVINLLIVTALVSAMHAQAVVLIGKGQRPRVGSVALSGLRVLPVVGVAEVVTGVATDVGLLLVIPGVVLALRFAVVAQSAAIEQRGVRAAWTRSWELSRNHGWHIAGYFLALSIVVIAVFLGGREIFSGRATGLPAVVLGIGIDTVVASVGALAGALLYFDLVARAASDGQNARHRRRKPSARGAQL